MPAESSVNTGLTPNIRNITEYNVKVIIETIVIVSKLFKVILSTKNPRYNILEFCRIASTKRDGRSSIIRVTKAEARGGKL